MRKKRIEELRNKILNTGEDNKAYKEFVINALDDYMLDLQQYVKYVSDMETAYELATRGNYKEAAHFFGKNHALFLLA